VSRVLVMVVIGHPAGRLGPHGLAGFSSLPATLMDATVRAVVMGKAHCSPCRLRCGISLHKSNQRPTVA
jgi:hypothetical protein